MNSWLNVQRFYKQEFGYPYIITDLIAVGDILKRCCMGYSNIRIAKRLDFTEQYITSTLIEFLKFSGWYKDLFYSPLAIYKQYSSIDNFLSEVYNKDMYAVEKYARLAFTICKRYTNLMKEVEKYGN